MLPLHDPSATRPRLLIARPLFEAVIERLSQHFTVLTNQGDAQWSEAQWISYLQSCDAALLTGSDLLTASMVQACPRLRIVANMAVGFNNLDLPALTRAGIQATNTPDVLTEATADFAFALLLATARRVGEGERMLRAGQWGRWRYDLLAGAAVHGTTLGMVGMGRIGQAIARRGSQGFGMRVIYCNRTRLAPDIESRCCAQWVDLQGLLKTADHVVLALPYSPAVHHLIGEAQLALMQPHATLVNIARGGIVNEAALAVALETGTLAGAGLDVFEHEPYVHPDLLRQQRAVLTPHIGSATLETRKAMADLAAENLIAFFSGLPPVTPINTPDKLAASKKS